MKLLIDAGNTRLKWAWCNGTALRDAGAAKNADLDFSTIWKNSEATTEVWIASVSSASANAALIAAIRQRFGVEPVFAVTRARACGVHVAYAQPENLGVDRFLGLIAAHAQNPSATVIASCGTALTLDALAADGTHLGGLIAPGPLLAQTALRGGAARLVGVPPGRVVDFAADSADAIESGTWLGAAALVERFVVHAARRLGAAPSVILTGGGAPQLSGLLECTHRIDADLVLLGLACLADAPSTLG